MNIKSIENFLRPVILAGIFIIPFIVLHISESLFFPYITGKVLVFRFLVEIIFFAWLPLAFTLKEYRPKKSTVLYAVSGAFLFMVVASLLGEYPARSLWSNFERMEGVVTQLHVLAYFVVLFSVIKTDKLWDRFLNTNVLASLLVGLYGLMQLAGKYKITQGGDRLDATIGNAGYLGGYMMVMVFVTSYLLFKNWQDKWWRYGYGVAILLQVFILFQSGTRSAVLGLIGGVLLSAALFFLSEGRHNKKARKWGLGFLVVVLILGGGFWLIKDSSFIQDSPALSRVANLSLDDNTLQSRLMIWQMSLEGVKEKPILGWGPGNFSFVFNKYYDPGMYNQEPWFDRSHNIFIDWLVAGGVIGLVLYVSIFLSVTWLLIRELFKKASDKLLENYEAAILTGLVASYVFNNLFIFDNIVSYYLFFGILAFITFKLSTLNKELWSKEVIDEKKTLVVSGAMSLVAFCLVLYFAVATPTFAAAGLIEAISLNRQALGAKDQISKISLYEESLERFDVLLDYHIPGSNEVLEQLINSTIEVLGDPNIGDDIKEKYVILTTEAVERRLNEEPRLVRLRLVYSNLLLTLGQTDRALEEIDKSLELSPNKQQIILQKARILLINERYEEALQNAKRAFELDESFNEVRKMYALIALRSGDEEMALDILSPVYETLAVNDDQFINALSEMGRYDLVAEIWQERTLNNPSDTDLWTRWAVSLYAFGDVGQAIAVIEDAIERNPEFKVRGLQIIEAMKEGSIEIG